jgi:hypothetical protein
MKARRSAKQIHERDTADCDSSALQMAIQSANLSLEFSSSIDVGFAYPGNTLACSEGVQNKFLPGC